MTVYIERTTGKLYKNTVPNHPSDSILPQVDVALDAELTTSPVFAIDTATVKKGLVKHYGGK